MNAVVRQYLATIGRRGGRRSRRRLDAAVARDMVRLREAKRAFKQYHVQCFWSFDPAYPIGFIDIEWVAKTLMKNGGRRAWEKGVSLCR